MDTVGAGDAFTGAFTVACASGMPLEKAIRFANAAGALATQGLGAQAQFRGAMRSLLSRGRKPPAGRDDLRFGLRGVIEPSLR